MSTDPPPDPFALPAWAPSVQDVAALLRARTKDASGREVGDFTSETRPTDTDVERLLIFGCGDVTANVGTELAQSLWAEARALAALKTACYVEQSYWPEQVGSDRSSWTEMWQMFTYQLANLRAAADAGGGVSSDFGSGSICTPINWGDCSTAAWPIDWWQRDLDQVP